jgi:hypothetical protein
MIVLMVRSPNPVSVAIVRRLPPASVSKTLALLMIAYTKRGVPGPLWNPDISRDDVLKQAGRKLEAQVLAQIEQDTPRAPWER